MPANNNAAAVAKAGGALAAGYIAKSAANDVVKAVFKEVVILVRKEGAETLVGEVKNGGGSLLAKKLKASTYRRLAADLAGQIGGTYSIGTVIDGQRYFVVWKGDEPFEVFPRLPEELGRLTERPELQNFQGIRHSPKSVAKKAEV